MFSVMKKNKVTIIGFRPDSDVETMLSRAEKELGWTRSKILNKFLRDSLSPKYARKRETLAQEAAA